MTPEEKLCSRTWRLLNSAGVLWSILSLGLLTGVGFLIRGIKAKNKLWIGLGIGFSIIGVALLISPTTFDSGTKEAPISSVANTIWGWSWITTFVGGIVLTFMINRKWLIWKAHATDSKWYAQVGSTGPQTLSTPAMGFDPNAGASALNAMTEPASQIQGGSDHGTAGQHAFESQPLDINAASIQDVARVLAVGPDVASRILDARQVSGPFTSFEQLVARTGVPPHLLIPVRHLLTFGPGKSMPHPNSASSSSNPTARRLDL